MLGLIPAAGKGTRFHELGRQYPKCILPYKEVPIIVHNIRSLVRAGCTEIIVGVSYHREMILETIGEWFDEIDAELKVYDVGDSGSMPETLRRCLSVTSQQHEDVAIILGDIVTDYNIYSCNLAWVSTTLVQDYSRWCLANVNEKNHIESFVDKPIRRPETNIALTGIYYFPDLEDFSNALDMPVFSDHEEEQLSSVMQSYINNGNAITVDPSISVTDLGTHTDFINNRGLSKAREFNNLIKGDGFITKASKDTEKIRAEYHWFQDLPTDLKRYVPAVYELDMGFGFGKESNYTMEFVPKPTLREIFLFLDGSLETWETIFDQLFTIQYMFGLKNNYRKRYLHKTLDKAIHRWNEIPEGFLTTDDDNRFLYMGVALNEMFEDSDFYERTDSVFHGDFCFSNILWDQNGVKLIDPRGEMFGSVYYDMAKLYHSVIGHYDFIDAELYSCKEGQCELYNKGKSDIEEIFLTKLKDNFSEEEIILIKMLTASLFISMIPLHYHNETNQKLFLQKFREIYDETYQEYIDYRHR